MIFFTHKKRVELIEEDKQLYDKLISLLKAKGTYLYHRLPHFR